MASPGEVAILRFVRGSFSFGFFLIIYWQCIIHKAK
jgi:hypothetical protein